MIHKEKRTVICNGGRMRRRGLGGGGGWRGLEGNIQLALPPPQRESGQAKPMQADRLRTDILAN
jgi:hypothetical protein